MIGYNILDMISGDQLGQVNRELMGVIESLQRKSEEEAGNPVDESSEEETEGPEDKANVSNRATDNSTDDSRKVCRDDDLETSPTEHNLRRQTYKRKKVADTGDRSPENDDVNEKPDDGMNSEAYEENDSPSSPLHVQSDNSLE